MAAAVVSGVEPPILLFHARTGLVTGAAAALLRRRRAFVRVGLDYSGGAGREREEQEDGLERRHPAGVAGRCGGAGVPRDGSMSRGPVRDGSMGRGPSLRLLRNGSMSEGPSTTARAEDLPLVLAALSFIRARAISRSRWFCSNVARRLANVSRERVRARRRRRRRLTTSERTARKAGARRAAADRHFARRGVAAAR